jgi:serine protease
MKGRKALYLATLASILLIAGGVMLYSVYKNNPSADTLPTQSTALSQLAKENYNFVPGQVIVQYKSTVDSNSGAVSAQSIPNINVESASKITANTYELTLSSPALNQVSAQSVTTSVAIPYNPGSSQETNPKPSVQQMLGAQETLQAVKELQANPNVASVQPNYIYQLSSLPNDTYVSTNGTSWAKGAFGSPTQVNLWGLKAINADKAWNLSTGSGVRVAIIDTGVDNTHPDLKNQMLRNSVGQIIGYNFINNTTDAMDDYGHGTLVAGIVAAQMNNGIGIAGVAPNAKIMPIKVFNDNGYSTDQSITEGIYFAIQNKAQVINMSLGGAGPDPVIAKAITAATQADIPVVVAAGNNANDVNLISPADDPNVISVGAEGENTDNPQDIIAPDGITDFSNFGSGLDLIAPGGETDSSMLGNILSTISSTNVFPTMVLVGNNYAIFQGTSLAAPYVTGAVADILQLHPNYTVDQIKSILYVSASNVPSPSAGTTDNYTGNLTGWNPFSGYGGLNVVKALQAKPFDLPVATLNGDALNTLNLPSLNSNLVISGTAEGTNFASYTVSWGEATFPTFVNTGIKNDTPTGYMDESKYYPTTWHPIIQSQQAINNGTLASMNQTALKNIKSNLLVIRLQSTNSSGFTTTTLQYYMLNQVNEASSLPAIVNVNGFGQNAIGTTTAVDSITADLYGDGNQEVVYTDQNGDLFAVNSQGQFLPNWKKNNSSATDTDLFLNLIPINNGNKQDIVATEMVTNNNTGQTTYKLFCFDGSGDIVWQKTFPNNISLAAGAGSSDQDPMVVLQRGDSKFIALNATNPYPKGTQNNLFIYDTNGNLVKTISNVAVESMAVGNLTTNREDLVFYGSVNNNNSSYGLYAVSGDNWQLKTLYTDGAYSSQPDLMLGDLTSDHKLDYVFQEGSPKGGDNYLLVVNNSGKLIAKKDLSTAYPYSKYSYSFPALADMTNSGLDEIIVDTWLNNNPNKGTTTFYDSNFNIKGQISTPGQACNIIADVDNNQQQDCLAVSAADEWNTISTWITPSGSPIVKYQTVNVANSQYDGLLTNQFTSQNNGLLINQSGTYNYILGAVDWGSTFYSINLPNTNIANAAWPVPVYHDQRHTSNAETPLNDLDD